MAETRTAYAYSFAGTFPLQKIARCFPGTVRVSKTDLVAVFPSPAEPAGTGEAAWAVAFDFGAVAFLGVAPERRAAILKDIEARSGPEPHPPLEEELLIEIDPDAVEAVSFDRVVVRGLDLRVFELIALLLAQSVSLDYYEEDVQTTLSRINVIAAELERRGSLRRPEKELVKLTGAAIVSKDQIIASLALLDKPSATWEDERLDRLYLALRSTLEIAERYHALESKLRSIQENLELFIDLIRHRRSARLEIIVAVLIAVELALLVYQVLETVK